MARTRRQIALSGFYHVIMRAVPNRSLFDSGINGADFLNALQAEKERDALEVFAYCLTDRAFHLVIREGISGITANVMRLSRFWANAVNDKRKEAGALFADRFYSAPLESPEVILDATRFVHRLPLQFGQTMDYPLSGFKHVFKRGGLLSGEEIIALTGGAIDYRLYCDSESDGKFRK